MAKEYVPIFFDWLETTQDLSPEEKGNLIDAVVSYSAGQEYEHLLTGGCRIAFRFLKGQVDRNSAISEARSRAGNSKRDQNGTGGIKTEQTGANAPNENENKDNSKEENNENDENKNRNGDDEGTGSGAGCSGGGRRADDLRLQETEERFGRFWTAYPRKEARQKAHAVFLRLQPDEETLRAMLAAIERQKASDQWQESGGKFVPHPTTWLNGRRWEDEPPKAGCGPGRTVTAQRYTQRDYSGMGETPEQMMARLTAMAGDTG